MSRMLTELTDGLPVTLVRGAGETVIRNIVEDSRCAGPGDLFVARPGGSLDGRRFVKDAIDRGASAVLIEGTNPPAPPDGRRQVALLSTPDVSAVLGALAERFHGNTGQVLRLVGVTGTNGKTTVTHLIHHVLTAVGTPCGLIGTVAVDDGAARAAAAMTTPPAIDTSRMLAAMVANGCRAAVLEVSSHALQQGRTAGLHFDVAVFTNLSGDHLDYHGSRDAYAETKATLFRDLPASGFAIVNADDPESERMVRETKASVVTCGLDAADAMCRATILHESIDCVECVLHGPWGALEVVLPLAGRHNVANALQAAAACAVLGVAAAPLQRALATCNAPPGRLESVTTGDDDVTVLVDYAHTDDALANVLHAVRPLVPHGARLCVVFGCGGDRDRTKRPRMGRVAAEIADEIIVTSDNPRTEDPQTIIADILPGVADADRRGYRDVQVLCDRQRAIELAVARSAPGDVVVIAGKGHEPYQIIGTEKRAFDDRAVAARALRRRRELVTSP